MRRDAPHWNVVAALAACGCTLTSPYPDAVVERGALCHSDVDEDLDGLVDCEDPGCADVCDERLSCESDAPASAAFDDDEDGLVGCADPDCDGDPACPEDVRAQCADGRDNDRDGRIDARDAGCWPLASVTTERCASVLGGTVELGPEDFRGGTLEDDPLGTGEGPWLRLAPVPAGAFGFWFDAVSTRRSSGSVAGATAHVVLRYRPVVNPDGSYAPSLPNFEVGLMAPLPTREPETPLAFLIAQHLNIAFTDDPIGGSGGGGLVPTVSAPARIEIDFEFAPDATVRARVRVGDAPEIVLNGSTVSSAPDSTAIGVSVVGPRVFDRGPPPPGVMLGGTVWLERATLTQSSFVRCGAFEPPLGIVERDGILQANTSLLSLVRGPSDTLCGAAAFEVHSAHVHSIVSGDDGVTFRRGDEIFGAIGDVPVPFLAPPTAVAYDAADGTFHVAVLGDGTGGRAVYVASSEDCEHWSAPRVAAMIPVADATRSLGLGTFPGPVAYDIANDGHRVTLFGSHAGAFAFLHARSAWGEPGTWSFDEAVDVDAPSLGLDPARADREFLRLHVVELGAPVVLADGVRTSRGWESVPALTLTPSHEAGAFDALDPIYPIALLEDACDPPSEVELCGRIFYSGLFDVLPQSGWGHMRVRLTPGPP